ncbi:MAG: hypothetical protein ACOVRN_03175 [Flavobacterium sp.]
MGKLKIVFCNAWNVGDIFLAQPFINNIVNTNGDHYEYYVWIRYSHFLFSDLPNIKNVNDSPELVQILGNITDYNRDNYVLYPEFDILVINTWIGTMNHVWNPSEGIRELFKDYLEECNLVSYLDCYRIILNMINDNHGIQIAYDFSHELAFPTFPKNVPITGFETFKSSANKKTVFLNNYLPQSGQKTPLQTTVDYIYVMEFLRNKGYIVILPEEDPYIIKYINANKIQDVYFCSEFITYSLNNYANSSELYYRSKICVNCDFSIYLDTGRNFIYFNRDFISDFKSGRSNNTKIHFSTQRFDFYFKNLMKNTEITPPTYATQYIADNVNDVIFVLNSIL